MELVTEKSKDYELLVLRYDPQYNKLVDAIEIIKKFIIDNDLILYGGTAIDFALRLKGDKIYNDESLAVPDLDFFSPDAFSHAYTLADILYEHGYTEARTIRAMHFGTMRVDIGDNHWVADISYVPPVIYEKLQTLKFSNMRVIHPDYQKLDLHSSLAFPYDNPPREVVFDRWRKDIKRYNLLDKYYPTEGDITVQKYKWVDVKPFLDADAVLTGVAAYAVYTAMEKLPDGVIAADLKGTLMPIVDCLEIVHFDLDKLLKRLGVSGAKTYEPYFNITPMYCAFEYNGVQVRAYSSANRLLSINKATVADATIKVANVQYTLKHLLAGKLRGKKYLGGYYLSLKKLIMTHPDVPLLQPSIEVYGGDNNSPSYEISISRVLNDLYGKSLYILPMNYNPAKSFPKNLPHPKFNPDDLEFLREQGREITEQKKD